MNDWSENTFIKQPLIETKASLNSLVLDDSVARKYSFVDGNSFVNISEDIVN